MKYDYETCRRVATLLEDLDVAKAEIQRLARRAREAELQLEKLEDYVVRFRQNLLDEELRANLRAFIRADRRAARRVAK